MNGHSFEVLGITKTEGQVKRKEEVKKEEVPKMPKVEKPEYRRQKTADSFFQRTTDNGQLAPRG